MKVVAWVFAVIVGLSVWYGLSSGSASTNSGPASEPVVLDGCHQFVERQLRAPATAEYEDEFVTGGPKVWTVRGNVDAENGFGALLRSDFSCTIRDHGDSWELVSLNLPN